MSKSSTCPSCSSLPTASPAPPIQVAHLLSPIGSHVWQGTIPFVLLGFKAYLLGTPTSAHLPLLVLFSFPQLLNLDSFSPPQRPYLALSALALPCSECSAHFHVKVQSLTQTRASIMAIEFVPPASLSSLFLSKVGSNGGLVELKLAYSISGRPSCHITTLQMQWISKA